MAEAIAGARSPERRPAPGHAAGALAIAGDGAMAGLYGAATIAMWFLLVDLWLREPLFTPSFVGNAVLGGKVEPGVISLFAVSIYTAVHSVLFIVFGTAYAWILTRLVRTPEFLLIAISVYVPLELGFVLATRLFVPQVAEVLGHGFIATGNMLAALAMALYLRFGQPHPDDRS